MALPALSKKYHTRRDIPFPDTTTTQNVLRSYLWLIKESLINAVSTGFTGANSRSSDSVWTVHSSSNSLTTSSSDLWGTGTFVSTNLVFANSGSARSWITLQNSTMGYYLTIDCQPASTSTQSLVSVWRIADGIVAGTTTARPRPTTPAVAEINLGYQSESLNNFVSLLQDTTASATHRLNITYSDDGFFYLLVSRASQGFHHAGWAFQKGVTSSSFPANPADALNFTLINFSTSTSAPGVPQLGTFTALSNTSQLFPTGARSSTGTGLSFVYFGATPFGGGSAISLVQDYYTAEFDVVPLYMRSAIPTGSVNRGIIPDWWCHSNRLILVNNTVNDPGGVVSHIVAGDVFLPWNGSIPTL